MIYINKTPKPNQGGTMLYELSEVQVKNIVAIVNDANIKGGSAQAIVEVLASLSSPINPGVAVAPKTKKTVPAKEVQEKTE